MHKKSLEAADTLKSIDDNSDKEDETQTENSDTKSSTQRRTPTTPTMDNVLNLNKPKPISDGSVSPSKSSSISPVTMSPPMNHHQHATQSNQRPSDDSKPKDYNLMSSPSSRAPPSDSYHLSPHEQHQQNAQQHPPPMAHHHTHPAASAYHYPLNPIKPDTDPEVFRWVNYNRDYPVSFIR